MELDKREEAELERKKELLEREMTEVLLNLKGEFAVYSGSESGRETPIIDEEKLKTTFVDETKIAKIEGEKITVAMPDVIIGESSSIDIKAEIIRQEVMEKLWVDHAPIDIPRESVPGPSANLEQIAVWDMKIPQLPEAIRLPDTEMIAKQFQETGEKLNETSVVAFQVPGISPVEMQTPAKVTIDTDGVKELVSEIHPIEMGNGIQVETDVKKIDVTIPNIRIMDVPAEVEVFEPKCKEIMIPEIDKMELEVPDHQVEVTTVRVELPKTPDYKGIGEKWQKTKVIQVQPRKMEIPTMPSFKEKVEEIVSDKPAKPKYRSPDSIPVPERPNIQNNIDAILASLQK